MSKYAENEKQKVAVCLHPSSYFCGYHSHDFFEMNFVVKGSCVNLIEGQNIIMDKGDMILIHPGAFHTLYADENCKVFNILIDSEWFLKESENILPNSSAVYEFIKQSKSKNFYKYVFCPDSPHSPSADVAKNLIAQAQSSLPVRYLLCESSFLTLLATLLQNSESAVLSLGTGKSPNKIISILTYLGDNYKTATLEDLSEKFFYSKTHLCRLFLQNTGKSFSQTLVDLRISKAVYFLKTTDMTVENIATAVGYVSVEYFQRLFKKMMGVTPGEYRKHN